MKKTFAILTFIVHAIQATLCFGGPKELITVHEAVVWAAQHKDPALPADVFQFVGPQQDPEAATLGPAVDVDSKSPEWPADNNERRRLLQELDSIRAERDEFEAKAKADQQSKEQREPAKGSQIDPVKEDKWQVMLCNAEGCDIWQAAESELSSPGRIFVACRTPTTDRDRAKTGKVTIVHGEERWPGKFFSQNDVWTVFDATKFGVIEESDGRLTHVPFGAPVPPSVAANWAEEDRKDRMMRLEFIEPVGAAPNPGPEPVHCVTITASWCKPCHRQQQDNGEGDSRVHCEYVDEDDAAEYGLAHVLQQTHARPVTCWQDATGMTRYFVGYISTKEIWQKIQANNPPTVQSYGGRRTPRGEFTLHAKPYIASMLSYWGKWIGEDVPVHIVLTRGAGIEKVNILRLSECDKSARSMLGPVGTLRITMPQATGPLKAITLQWDLDANRITTELLVDDLEHLNQKRLAFGTSGPQTYGLFVIDDILIIANWGSIISGLQTIASLFSPTLDLQLPSEIDLTAILRRDHVEVTFTKGPSVYFAEFLRGTLVLQKTTISTEQVEAFCTGPWFVPGAYKHRVIKVD